MTKSIPNYILFLFIVVSLILFYIIAMWMLDTFFTSPNSVKEGFNRDEYTYYPNKKEPNLLFKFAIMFFVESKLACITVASVGNVSEVGDAA